MNLKLTITILLVILVVVFAGWYFYTKLTPNFSQNSQSSSTSGLTVDNDNDTTANISSDLNQTPNDSTMTDDLNALDASLKGF